MVEKRKLWQNCVRIVIRELNPLWRLRVSMELERRANPNFGLGVVRISNLFTAKQYSVCEIITKGIACNMCIVPANYNVHCLNKHPETPHSERRIETYTFTACLLRRKDGGLTENNTNGSKHMEPTRN
jgi:hypothetical protein